MKRNYRNSGLIDQNKLKHVAVIGAGSIGSTIVQDLAMMGYDKITVVDNDIVAVHNLSTTRYPEDLIGSSKVQAASYMCKMLNPNVEIETVYMSAEAWMANGLPDNVIMATDTMHSRLAIYEKWLENDSREALIDIRMASMVIERIVVTKDNDNFMNWYKPDSEIPDEPCTMKHTVFTTSIASGLTVTGLFSTLSNRAYFEYIYMGLSPLIVKKELFVKGE